LELSDPARQDCSAIPPHFHALSDRGLNYERSIALLFSLVNSILCIHNKKYRKFLEKIMKILQKVLDFVQDPVYYHNIQGNGVLKSRIDFETLFPFYSVSKL